MLRKVHQDRFLHFFIVHVPLNLLKATKPLKGKSVPLTTDSVQAVDFLYSAFCCNYISFLGLASPYVMSFITEGDILRNKPSQITPFPSNPSEAEWERATNCQHKYHLKWWNSQKPEISVCSKTYKPNLLVINCNCSSSILSKNKVRLELFQFSYFGEWMNKAL